MLFSIITRLFSMLRNAPFTSIDTPGSPCLGLFPDNDRRSIHDLYLETLFNMFHSVHLVTEITGARLAQVDGFC